MSERFGHNDEAWAKIADPSTICDRLRGQYNIPVSDGAGPLNGSMVFNRSFQTTPIQNAAADLIEQLQTQIASLTAENERLELVMLGLENEATRAWFYWVANECKAQNALDFAEMVLARVSAALQPKEGE
jgi:hypothetical protein